MADRITKSESIGAGVIISANSEWRAVRQLYPTLEVQGSPFGEWLMLEQGMPGGDSRAGDVPYPILVLNGGWGKISAAASTQYLINRWEPQLIVNLGTCGGFEGQVEKHTILLAERTVVYDIVEQMADYAEHIAHYSTSLDLTWLKKPYPHPVLISTLVSADRDLSAGDIEMLHDRYGAVAGDWESGAIAWVTERNHKRCLILRGVTDLVGSGGGEAYGNIELFHQNAGFVMRQLIAALPAWLECAF